MLGLAVSGPFPYSTVCMNQALVVIPTYNEKENVRDVSQAVLTALPEAHILFVDDNSPDGTGQIADEMGAKDPRIHCLHRKDKQGLGRAYIAGFQVGAGA